MEKLLNALKLVTATFALGLFLIGLNQISLMYSQRGIISYALGQNNASNYFTPVEAVDADESRVLGVSVEPARSISVGSYNYQAWLLDRWFEAQNSPLVGHGDDFVRACERYQTPSDCTLLPAIAKVETAYCTTDISAQQFNCWGFGGSGPNRILYDSFEDSIDEITRRLMIGYTERFFRDPSWGGLTYCGAHCVNWGRYVESEQIRIKQYFRNNGFTDFD